MKIRNQRKYLSDVVVQHSVIIIAGASIFTNCTSIFDKHAILISSYCFRKQKMKEKLKADSNNAADSDSDSDSSSTDSDTHTITAGSNRTGDTATSPHETAEQQNKPRDAVTENDDDDASSSDSSTEDEDVTSHTADGNSRTKNTRSARSAIDNSHHTAAEEVALRQNPTAANGR